jgi:hypothetical protein
VADIRTTVTEVVTGLGMLGSDLDGLLAARPRELGDVPPHVWDDLAGARAAGRFDDVFAGAFANGRAFATADDGLRHRRPRTIEWRGMAKAPGDEVVPADLHVDHVYLVSCKYLSRIVINASPSHLFERLLTGGHGQRSTDWFGVVAPHEYAAFYADVRDHRDDLALPADLTALTSEQRDVLRKAVPGRLPVVLAASYRALCDAVGVESARRWREGLADRAVQERVLWRMLRIGSAPYFVLGASDGDLLRLRITTPWDWRRRWRFEGLEVAPGPGGQPRVDWCAAVRDRDLGGVREVRGHVEVRWSHGKFCGPPEAKVYLDTPYVDVPGYVPLT